MKKLALLITFVLLSVFQSQAQNTLFNALRLAIAEQNAEIDLNEKLIAYNYWSSENLAARENNAQFEKAASVFRFSKLKNAPAGIVVVLINLSDESSAAQITLRKDGVEFSFSVTKDNLDIKKEADGSNGLFDPTGRVVAKNIPSDRIYTTVQSLITR